MHTPLTTLSEPAFEITGGGTAVLTGISANQPSPFVAQQQLVFASPSGVLTLGCVTSVEYARTQSHGDRYALTLSGVAASDIPAETRVYCHRSLVAGRDISGRPDWTGDLDDDCSARWAGLILRAEEMEPGYWWWAVSDIELDSAEVDSSNRYSDICPSGNSSRHQAESCATRYLLQEV